MLLEKAQLYYKAIKDKFENSYLAEDIGQIIIGIDCDYIDSSVYSFDTLKGYHKNAEHPDAPFAGLFGVFSYEGVNFFEQIGETEAKNYDFPKFIYANAKAYLHFDKVSKIYTFYGDENRYYNFLEGIHEINDEKKDFEFKILSDLSYQKKHFEDMVLKAKEYIKQGDIFQVVLSQELQISTNMDSFTFYEILASLNPSPYMFHFPTPYGDVVGSSPELVFQIKNSEIFVAPIAGTRPRGEDLNQDQNLEKELLHDEKELAEHKMLIDLARNDIGRVAKKQSVVVKNAMHIQRYQSVMHIVSEVYGQKSDEFDIFDVIASIFPAGTLSGTPKIRAMQIIAELESQKRGIYGGGIGFLNFNNNVLMAILIRSAFFAKNNDVFIRSGAGVVYDSIPQKEYEEICHKRASVLKVFKDNAREIK
ncbi:MAG: anthranilate synthase component I family protein [Campylobacter sp.]|nr:anthranilate synthase component I family protein [Campylobacter sp.]